MQEDRHEVVKAEGDILTVERLICIHILKDCSSADAFLWGHSYHAEKLFRESIILT